MMQQGTTIIHCKRIFHHPVSKVFQMFIQPQLIQQWFGPKEFSIGKVMTEPHSGGVIEIEMITPKGDIMWVKGHYEKVQLERHIEYSFTYQPDMPGFGESLVSIKFLPVDDSTEVNLAHTIYKAINAEGRAKGWEDGFDKMESLLSQNQSMHEIR